jgi:hypothetical protein
MQKTINFRENKFSILDCKHLDASCQIMNIIYDMCHDMLHSTILILEKISKFRFIILLYRIQNFISGIRILNVVL